MKRRLLFLALLLNTVWASAQFSGSGSGTQNDPYQIYNPIQLNQLRGFLNTTGVYFKLMSNVNLEEWIEDNNPTQGWQPVGTSGTPFKGILEGNGKTISGLTINRGSYDYVGFFGKLDGATISNLTIEGEVVGGNYTGGIVGYNNSSTLTNVSFNGNIVGGERVGGISGQASAGVFTGCNYTGDITSSGTGYVGGIVGYTDGTTTFTSCTVNTNIMAIGECVGGVVGYSSSGSTSNITSCFTYGTLSASKYVGGIAGHINQHTITGSGSIMDITSAEGYTGGIIGSGDHMSNSGSDITRKVSNCFALGDIKSEGNNVGGIVGYDYGYYKYYYSSSYYCGCYSRSYITNCYYSGKISGLNKVGGIVGYAHQSQINKCYSIGSVSGYQYVGGIAGYMLENNSSYRPSIYSSASLHSDINAITSDVGRIYGKKDAGNIGVTGSQTGNLALATCRVVLNGVLQEVMDGDQNGGSTGKSTFKVRGTYQALGWDFTNDWSILDTESHPYNKAQAAPPVIESGTTGGQTTISGKSIDGGEVYLKTNGKLYTAICSSNKWSISTDPLQAGEKIETYAVADDLVRSYTVSQDITYAGSGTKSDPYQIYTAEDLVNASGDFYYKLMNDIDLSSWISTNSPTTGWRPIGKGSSAMSHFDGDYHTISGLWINSSDDYVGLFSNASGAEIKNLNVVVAKNKKIKGQNYTGGIVGRSYNGVIENCSLTGDVEGQNYTGGIVGSDDSGTNSSNTLIGNVQGTTNVGGIAGSTSEGSITGAYVEGTISSTVSEANIGGIAGYSNSDISQCFSKGSVSATGISSYGGGIAGQSIKSVMDCYSFAEVTSTLYVGGIVGYNFGPVKYSYASGNLKGVNDKTFAGGVVGYNDGTSATVIHCVAINEKIDISHENGWATRIVGGTKNDAPTPDMDNYANKDMILSINGVSQKVYDDNLNGSAKTTTVLKTRATYANIDWDFDNIWEIDENESYPYQPAFNNDGSVKVNSISLNKTTISLLKGDTETLVATVLPENATYKDVVWSTDNSAVATVSNGIVTAVAEGTATIVVKTTDGSNLSASCSVTVTSKPVYSNTLRADDVTMLLSKKSVRIPVYLDNIVTMCGFEFYMELPEGFKVKYEYDEDEEEWLYGIEKGERCKSDHILKCQKTGNGIYYIFCYSSNNSDFYESAAKRTLPVVYITVEAESAATVGSYALNINDIIINHDENGTIQEYKVNNMKSAIEVQSSYMMTFIVDGVVYSSSAQEPGTLLQLPTNPTKDGYVFIGWEGVTDETIVPEHDASFVAVFAMKGDINNDNKVNITDLTSLVNIMLNKVTADERTFKVADLNNDSKINITDLTSLVNLMLNVNSIKEAIGWDESMTEEVLDDNEVL